MNITAGQKAALLTLLLQFISVFATNPMDIGLSHLMKHDIDVGNAKPIWQRQYCIPHAYWPLLAQQMEWLKTAGVITESQSLWSSPLVVVCKKTLDNSIQIWCCLNLWGINKLIKVTPYHMPCNKWYSRSIGRSQIYFHIGPQGCTQCHQQSVQSTLLAHFTVLKRNALLATKWGEKTFFLQILHLTAR